MQIDDLLSKLDNASGDLDRLRDEKDQEISLLQEGMDATIQQLHEAQQVCVSPFIVLHRISLASQNQGLNEEATNAQIDTLILDNRKKLNQIIGMSLHIPIPVFGLTFDQTRSLTHAWRRLTKPSMSLNHLRKWATSILLLNTLCR